MLLDCLPLSSYCLTSKLQDVGPISASRQIQSRGWSVLCFWDQPLVVHCRSTRPQKASNSFLCLSVYILIISLSFFSPLHPPPHKPCHLSKSRQVFACSCSTTALTPRLTYTWNWLPLKLFLSCNCRKQTRNWLIRWADEWECPRWYPVASSSPTQHFISSNSFQHYCPALKYIK